MLRGNHSHLGSDLVSCGLLNPVVMCCAACAVYFQLHWSTIIGPCLGTGMKEALQSKDGTYGHCHVVWLMSLGLLVSGQLRLVSLQAIDFGPWSIAPGGNARVLQSTYLGLSFGYFLRTFLIKTFAAGWLDSLRFGSVRLGTAVTALLFLLSASCLR